MPPSTLVVSSDLPAAMTATGALETLSLIELLPTEVIEEIMKAMRPTELAKLALASKRLLAVFLEAQSIILTEVLSKQPEFKTMLLVATTTERDFQLGRMLYPRTITLDSKASGFDPSTDQSKDIVLLKSNMEEDPNFMPIRMQTRDLVRVWRSLKVVDWYVDMYPTIRWRDQPEQRRCLRPDEEARLRKAIARWYLYTIHFQANRRRDLYKPKKWANDNRLHHIRLMPTREILELQDFWGVIYDLVSQDLCSSVEQLDPEDGGGVDRVPWGKDQGRHGNIVSTYMKLDPDMLKDFLYRYCCRPRMDIVHAARMNKREFNLDTESMSSAIMTVLEERMMLKPKDVSSAPRSGILDEDRDDDVDPKIWEQDDAPNGQPPLDPAQIRAFPWEHQKRLAYGDDGSGEPR